MKALDLTMRMNIGENAQMALTTLREKDRKSTRLNSSHT